MTGIGKLVWKIKTNPSDVRFSEARKACELIGFSLARTHGSHHVFKKENEVTILNFQPKKGKIPTYQAQQLIAMIDKYWEAI